MRGIPTLYRDQYGHTVWAHTVRELCERAGYSRAQRMYVDRNGETFHVGYVVGPHWFSAFRPVEVAA